VVSPLVLEVAEPGLDVPMEAMICFNPGHLHSVVESLDEQAGPSQWLPLAICKTLGSKPAPTARPGAALPSCALCIAILGPYLGPHSGFCDRNQGAGWGGRSITAPQCHSFDSNYGKAIASN